MKIIREYKNVATGEMTSSSAKLKEWLIDAMTEKDKRKSVIEVYHNGELACTSDHSGQANAHSVQDDVDFKYIVSEFRERCPGGLEQSYIVGEIKRDMVWSDGIKRKDGDLAVRRDDGELLHRHPACNQTPLVWA